MVAPSLESHLPIMSFPVDRFRTEAIELHPHQIEATNSPTAADKEERTNCFTKFLDSFRPRENFANGTGEGDPSSLNRSLKARHLQFIALGGSIGAGLFIGCGKALAIGGPGSLLIAFAIVSIMLFCVMHALGELAATYPINGMDYHMI